MKESKTDIKKIQFFKDNIDYINSDYFRANTFVKNILYSFQEELIFNCGIYEKFNAHIFTNLDELILIINNKTNKEKKFNLNHFIYSHTFLEIDIFLNFDKNQKNILIEKNSNLEMFDLELNDEGSIHLNVDSNISNIDYTFERIVMSCIVFFQKYIFSYMINENYFLNKNKNLKKIKKESKVYIDLLQIDSEFELINYFIEINNINNFNKAKTFLEINDLLNIKNKNIVLELLKFKFEN